MGKKAKTICFLFLVLTVTGGYTINVTAHPGRTASDDCHYCRTNCDSWGVAWNQRHCHNSYTAPKPAPVVAPAPEPTIDYTILNSAEADVTRVVDGDTIQVKFSDGVVEKVRLIGIDTPETVDPRKPVECFGKEASAKMNELVNGKTVRLARKEDENRGSYGRLLRYVYVNDLFINAEMIKQGYAYAYIKYPFDAGLMEEFKQHEKEAREQEIGLWAPSVCAEGVSPVGSGNQNNEATEQNAPLSADISEAIKDKPKNVDNDLVSNESGEVSTTTIIITLLIMTGLSTALVYGVYRLIKRFRKTK